MVVIYMQTIKDFLPINTKRRSGLKLSGVKFLVSHDTGNPNSTASGNVNYYKNSANEMSASAHLFVDEKGIIECIPLNEKAWHVRYNVPKDNEMYGVDANDYSIGIELCYFPNDVSRTQKSYDKYVELHADLVIEHSLVPRRDIVGHYTLDPGRKIDPMSAFKVIGKSWDDFIIDVENSVILKTKQVEIEVIEPTVEDSKMLEQQFTIINLLRKIISLILNKKI